LEILTRNKSPRIIGIPGSFGRLGFGTRPVGMDSAFVGFSNMTKTVPIGIQLG